MTNQPPRIPARNIWFRGGAPRVYAPIAPGGIGRAGRARAGEVVGQRGGVQVCVEAGAPSRVVRRGRSRAALRTRVGTLGRDCTSS